ncbi:Hypp7457 [Branchiostoma lanceolatum]|uniref:Hypp7457 protein n=1 Tax=Branchiostoma lanceolatum TaxID=7740 RepID=A0A8K0EE91_BRALA|nr:Hypp7457 [Branchiostoma lanceolatum]
MLAAAKFIFDNKADPPLEKLLFATRSTTGEVPYPSVCARAPPKDVGFVNGSRASEVQNSLDFLHRTTTQAGLEHDSGTHGPSVT